MGADGGLTFCKVRDLETVRRLLSPFDVSLNWARDSHAESHEEYLRLNAELVKDFVFLEYGSFCYTPCWYDIQDMLSEIPDVIDVLGEDATLSDVLDDNLTTPFDCPEFSQFVICRFLWNSWGSGWKKYRNHEIVYDDHEVEILNMRLSDWAHELNRAISVKTIWIVETWT